jgi:hypothetical protein
MTSNTTMTSDLRVLDACEIDAISGAKGKDYDLGFGIHLFVDGGCYTVSYFTNGGHTFNSSTTCN